MPLLLFSAAFAACYWARLALILLSKFGGPTLIFHEKIAIQLGNPLGYDWFLTDILIRQGRYPPNALIQRIRAGEFDMIIFSQKPYSSFEQEVYKIVSGGPYS